MGEPRGPLSGEWNLRRHRSVGTNAAEAKRQRLERMTNGVLNRRCLVTAVDHAVRALFVVARAVGIPVRFFHQLTKRPRIAFAQQIAGALPAEHVPRRVAPRRTAVLLVACEEIQEQAGLAERPGFAAATAAEDVAEERLRLCAAQEM